MSTATPLRLFAFSLSSLLCVKSFDTCARLLITHFSSSFGFLASKGFSAFVTVLTKNSLIASAVFSASTRWSSLFDQSLPTFSIQPSNTYAWPQMTNLALLLLFLALTMSDRLLLPESGRAFVCSSPIEANSSSDQNPPTTNFCSFPGCSSQSIRVKVSLELEKVASPPWNVLITVIISFSGKRSPATARFTSSSYLGMPIQSLRSVMINGVLRFGATRSVFLSHSARLHTVSA